MIVLLIFLKMFIDNHKDETTLPKAKYTYNFPNRNRSMTRISYEPAEIEQYLSQISIDPVKNIEKLLEISDEQYITIKKEHVSDIMAVLSSTFDEDGNNEEMVSLRRKIFKLLKNISDKADKNYRSFCDILSDTTYLSLLLRDFPTNYYSTQLLSKIVNGSDKASEYIVHEIVEKNENVQLLLSPDNSIDVIENVLILFSSAFSRADHYNPEIMDVFVDFAINLISSSTEDLLEILEKSLKKMAKKFEEVATKIIPIIPIICNFDEDDPITNMKTNLFLKTCVKKLKTYEILLAVNPEKVLYYISRCFDQPGDSNDGEKDYSLFSILRLLTIVDDMTPFYQNAESIEMLFNNFAAIINRNEKFELKENAVLAVCRLIKYGTETDVKNFLNSVDFHFIFDFAEQGNVNVQKAVLEALANIDTTQSSDFMLNFFSDEMKMKTLNDLTKSEDKEVAQIANLIFEKVSC